MLLPDHLGALAITRLDKGIELPYRAASFVIRFSTEQLYLDAVAFYTGARPAPGGPLPQQTSLQMGSYGDMELLLIWGDDSHAKQDCIIVYYEVPDGLFNSHKDLERAHRKLLKNNSRFREIDPPQPDSPRPSAPDGSAQQGARDDVPERSLLEADSGDQFGLMVNPPYPHGFLPGPPLPRRGHLLPLLLGFVAGALVWPALRKLLFRKKNRR